MHIKGVNAGKVIFLFLMILHPILSNSQQNKSFNTVYVNSDIDNLPSYPGGEDEMYQFIHDYFHVNNSISRENSDSSLQVLIVNFIVDSTGHISDIKYSQSYNLQIELEITRVMKQMPVWNPGIKNGVPVSARVYLPINFIITGNEFNIVNSQTEMIVGNKNKNKVLKFSIIGVCVVFMYLLITKQIHLL